MDFQWFDGHKIGVYDNDLGSLDCVNDHGYLYRFWGLALLFVQKVSDRWMGIANAVAAGLMLGASIGLIIEGVEFSATRLIVGVVLGLALIILARKWLDGHGDVGIEAMTKADFRKMLMIIGIMTVHSFAEGVGVGVAYGNGQMFGTVITTAIAIHNIPEGLAISLVLIPRGVSVWRAAGWSVFSSLPQPIMAVLAFLFVLVFRPILPVGLGLAAGAMIWMVFRELWPEAIENIPRVTAATAMSFAAVAMIGFQLALG